MSAAGEWSIVLNSIGSGGASIVGALRQISQAPEQLIAARLFQAPSLLFKNLSLELAEQAALALTKAGLDCAVQSADAAFTPGDSEHEIALAVRDYGRMASVLEAVAHLLGVPPAEARRLLCQSPAVLLGRISGSTVDALRRRFEPLGVEVDASRPAEARFDVFLGDCPAAARAGLAKSLAVLGLPVAEGGGSPLLAEGLALPQAERAFEALNRARLPGKVVNRDFQRFDLRLEEARPGPELAAFLEQTGQIPPRLVPKLLERLPIVTHSNIRHAELVRHLETLAGLGAKASGQLLAFQQFGLAFEAVADPAAARQLLAGLGGLDLAAAEQALACGKAEGPFSNTQARWLAYELKRVGAPARLVLR